jgi:uncharacterized protein DUF6734
VTSSKVARAVWSYWSRPMAHGSRWPGQCEHLRSWVLSLETAKRHFKTTALVTDDAGAALLVDGLGLKFDDVSTRLNNLPEAASDWWGLGKLAAYGCQAEPFVHVDSDVYLWSPLPDRLLTAPVLGQNPESFIPGMSYYKPEVIERALANGGWLPEEWLGIKELAATVLGAVCCGIIGGTDMEFLHHYSSQAIGLVTHPRNQALLARVPDCASHMILAEQFLLWACLEYHNSNAASKFKGINIKYLYAREQDAYNGTGVAAYTHLIGPAKKNPVIASRLERRLKRSFPEYEARICNLSGRDR